MPLSTPGSQTAPSSVSEIGERALIERIRRRLPPLPPHLIVGPGDDAAVVAGDRGGLQILTTDAVIEGIHFDFRLSSPADVGYKALAVNVSDVAAMGGTARVALLSLMLPDSTLIQTVDGLLDGFLSLATSLKVALAGGNISRSPGAFIADVTVVGSVKPRKVLTRGGGSEGDALFVSGSIGAAAAGLGWLRAQKAGEPSAALSECIHRHRRPEPRSRLGVLLGRTRAASACMDLSDGLSDAVRQLAEASGTGARIDASSIPVHPGAIEWFKALGKDPIEASVRGGDDYELLFTVPARRAGRLRGVLRLLRGLPVTRIGELTRESSIDLVRNGASAPLPAGFSHF